MIRNPVKTLKKHIDGVPYTLINLFDPNVPSGCPRDGAGAACRLLKPKRSVFAGSARDHEADAVDLGEGLLDLFVVAPV